MSLLNIDKLDLIIEEIQFALDKTFEINYLVSKKFQENIFPQIVVKEIDNLDLNTMPFIERRSQFIYEISIYCNSMNDGETVEDVQLARNLECVVGEVMGNIGMKRITCIPAKNDELNIYQITMRFSINLFNYRNEFY